MDSKRTAPSSPLVDLIVRRTEIWGGLLLALSAVLLAGAIAFGLAARPDSSTVAAEDVKTKLEKEADLGLDGKTKAKDKSASDTGKLLGLRSVPAGGMVWCLASALLLGIGGGLAVSRSADDRPTPTLARKWILVFGGTLGLLTSIYGLFLMSQDLGNVLKAIEDKDIRSVVGLRQGLTALFVGLVVTFVSLLPARADERNQASLRRLIHGYNSVLNGVLLLLILVGVNVAAHIWLPQKLDTTENSFYTLGEPSKKVLDELNVPVRAYLILPGLDSSRFISDVRTLLQQCADRSTQFRFKEFSAGVDNKAIMELARRLNAAELIKNRLGVLLSFGADEKQIAFVPLHEMFSANGETGIESFQGEAKLLTEIAFFSSSDSRSPVVYFVQGHGELDMTGAAAAAPGVRNDRSAMALKKMLTDSRYDVRTVLFGPGAPAVSLEGADAVVVLAPSSPLSAEAIAALDKYAFPGADKKPGKLMLLLPAWKELRSDAVGSTGLDAFLARVGLKPDNSVLLAQPNVFRDIDDPLMIVLKGFLTEGDPLSPVLGDRDFLGYHTRPIEILETPNASIKARPFLVTNRLARVWREPNFGTNAEATYRQFPIDGKLRASKKLAQQLPVGWLVTEQAPAAGPPGTPPGPGGEKPRMVVVGTGDCFSDSFLSDPANRLDPSQYTSLFKGLLDWVRDKPATIGIEPKGYKTFSLNKSASESRVVWIPLALVCLSSIVMGIGVWILRRR